MRRFISNYFGFEGRLSRRGWWTSAIIVSMIGFTLFFLTVPPLLMRDVGSLEKPGAPATDVIGALADARTISGWAGLALLMIFLYPLATISIKRRHDRNSRGDDVWGFFAVLAIAQLVDALGLGMTTMNVDGTAVPVPLPILFGIDMIIWTYGIYLLVVLGFLKGTAGPNNYGPDPLQG